MTEKTIGVIARPNKPFPYAMGRIVAHRNTVFLVKYRWVLQISILLQHKHFKFAFFVLEMLPHPISDETSQDDVDVSTGDIFFKWKHYHAVKNTSFFKYINTKLKTSVSMPSLVKHVLLVSIGHLKHTPKL